MKSLFLTAAAALVTIAPIPAEAAPLRPHGCPPPQTWRTSFSFGEEVPETGDFNGDGLDDVITFYRSHYGGSLVGDAVVALNTGGSFGPPSLWHPFFGIQQETLRIGDFNGDGRDDIATFLHGTGGIVYVALSVGNSFAASSVWISGFATGKGVPLVGDFDGDGDDDIASFETSTGEVRVARSNGANAFVGHTRWLALLDVNVPFAGDFDGDRIDDIGGMRSDNLILGTARVALSKGFEFGEPEDWATLVPFHATTEVFVSNFTATGPEDVALVTNAGALTVLPSDGSSFAWDPTSAVWQRRLRSSGQICRPGYFNRDLNADFAVFQSGGNEGDVLVSLTGGHARSSGVDRAVFGYGTMGTAVLPPVGSRPPLQEVPIVLGLFSFDEREPFGSPLGRDAAFFDSLFFGPGKPNLRDWVLEMSRGTFTFSRAGVYSIEMGEVPESGIRVAMHQALADAGFDFRAYDTDGDGTVRTDELCIATIANLGDAGGLTSGAVQTIEYTDGGGSIDIATRNAGADHLGRADLYLHEVCHMIGMVDLYSSACFNNFCTLAHCNAGYREWEPDPAIRDPFYESHLLYLDGWHRMRLGWIEPTVYDVRDGPAYELMTAPQFEFGNLPPVIVHDGDVGTDQYYLFEYRTPEYQSGERIWSNQDEEAYLRHREPAGGYPFAGYDSDVHQVGVYPWFVKMDSPDRHVTENVGLKPGAGDVLDSVLAGDDVVNDAGEVRPGPDEILQTVPARQITRGDNDLFDSILAGDDIVSGTRILPGPNQVLDTVRAGDDVEDWADDRIRDELVFLAADPDRLAERGSPDHIIESGNIAEFRWHRAQGDFQTGAAAGPNSATVAWGDPYRPYMEKWPAGEVRAGNAITVEGRLGPQIGTYVPTLECLETGRTTPLQINAWANTVGIWTIPSFLAPGEYILYIRQTDDAHPAVVSNTVPIMVEDTYQPWLDLHFTAAQQSDPSTVGDEVDLDGDGVSTVGEWASGGNPWVFEPHIGSWLVRDGSYVQIFFPLREGLSGVRVAVESSHNLTSWSASVDHALYEENYLGNPGVHLYVNDGYYGSPRFFRLSFRRATR